MHLEKGFTLKESNYIDFMVRIRQVVEALNWELFCEKNPSVDEELVHEFNANLISSELIEVLVRGIESAKIPDKVEPMEPKTEPDATSMFKTQSPHPNLQDELSKLMDIMQHMQWQQQAYWRYSKIRDDSMRGALTKIYNDPFIFVPNFPDFIFEPWSPLSKKEQSDSCKNKDDGAKDELNLEGFTNK
ncbi:hypothetical protein PVK06_008926 [Gossypium arboreum]|uniref:Uncharacterized protein n=1 Tax=Gossypium arboreum TaxID=29729 RepID=A0ABR0QLC3_GOSAR|nr:hypothetical protein PVK06_008926 [Gossypium arboreum]